MHGARDFFRTLSPETPNHFWHSPSALLGILAVLTLVPGRPGRKSISQYMHPPRDLLQPLLAPFIWVAMGTLVLQHVEVTAAMVQRVRHQSDVLPQCLSGSHRRNASLAIRATPVLKWFWTHSLQCFLFTHTHTPLRVRSCLSGGHFCEKTKVSVSQTTFPESGVKRDSCPVARPCCKVTGKVPSRLFLQGKNTAFGQTSGSVPGCPREVGHSGPCTLNCPKSVPRVSPHCLGDLLTPRRPSRDSFWTLRRDWPLGPRSPPPGVV